MSEELDKTKDDLGLPQTASLVQTFRAALSLAKVTAAEARGETVATAEIVNLQTARILKKSDKNNDLG